MFLLSNFNTKYVYASENERKIHQKVMPFDHKPFEYEFHTCTLNQINQWEYVIHQIQYFDWLCFECKYKNCTHIFYVPIHMISYKCFDCHSSSHSHQGPLWSLDSWIYNYLCNQCLSPLKLWVRNLFMVRCARYNIMW